MNRTIWCKEINIHNERTLTETIKADMKGFNVNLLVYAARKYQSAMIVM